jgi:uncharacterized protein involved in type VI secretion and phage assembly
MTPQATAEQHVASYDLQVDGADVAREHLDRITEIRVVDYLRLPDVCGIRITYPRGRGVDDMPFEIGKSVEVRLGAKEALMPQTIFKGEITTVEPEFGAGGVSVLIRAYDRGHRLHRTRTSRTFANQTSSDIVEKLCDEQGLQSIIVASGEPHEHLHQENETDWDFIWRLAERVGFEFVIEDETAYFGPPDQEAAVEVRWPESLRSFRPRLTAVQQVKEVTLRTQDPKTKQAIEVSATSPNQIARIGIDRDTVAGAFGDDAKVHVATEPVASSAEGNALAQALLDKLANGYIAADGIAPGNPKIRAGTVVKVEGVGTRFSGTYRVATSTHIMRGSGYETHFANSPAHTILGAVNGEIQLRFANQLVIGVVTNNADPEDMGRVSVKFPALGDDIESAWARIATPHAGNERGLLMMPQVGDEVLIGFEHGDMRRPFVLGSLFNGKDKPGDDLLQDEKGAFAVKSDDKAYLESAKDFTIKSGGPLTIQVSDSGTVTVDGDLTLDVSNAVSVKSQRADVTIEGQMSLTLKCGPSQIQLSASGVTISGPTINIG